jgi:hypothetical protein
MRKRLIALALAVIPIATLGVVGLQFRARQERFAKLARGQVIDREHCNRITKGMSEDDVEAILGGPPGDFAIHPVEYCHTCPLPLDFKCEGGLWEFWTGDEGQIEILFDAAGTTQFVWFATGTRSPSLVEQVRAWLLRLRKQ